MHRKQRRTIKKEDACWKKPLPRRQEKSKEKEELEKRRVPPPDPHKTKGWKGHGGAIRRDRDQDA